MNDNHRRETSTANKLSRLACAAIAAWFLAAPVDSEATLLTTPLPAGIPTGTTIADDLIVDFQFLFAKPLPDGAILSFQLTTTGLDGGENVVVDLFASAGGEVFLGTAYSGQFAELSVNCRVGSSLCASLLDGDFSVGLRMTGGAALLTSYTVTGWMPKAPALATIVTVPTNGVPEPGTIPLAATALALGALALRRSPHTG